jgi:mRNA-degrading endonuclease toxin of MazEF toxin-antitoxin module
MIFTSLRGSDLHPALANQVSFSRVVSQIITADRAFLRERIGRVSPETMARVESGLRLVLGLT